MKKKIIILIIVVLAVCVLPLPVPASIYGLILLLAGYLPANQPLF